MLQYHSLPRLSTAGILFLRDEILVKERILKRKTQRDARTTLKCVGNEMIPTFSPLDSYEKKKKKEKEEKKTT